MGNTALQRTYREHAPAAAARKVPVLCSRECWQDTARSSGLQALKLRRAIGTSASGSSWTDGLWTDGLFRGGRTSLPPPGERDLLLFLDASHIALRNRVTENQDECSVSGLSGEMS